MHSRREPDRQGGPGVLLPIEQPVVLPGQVGGGSFPETRISGGTFQDATEDESCVRQRVQQVAERPVELERPFFFVASGSGLPVWLVHFDGRGPFRPRSLEGMHVVEDVVPARAEYAKDLPVHRGKIRDPDEETVGRADQVEGPVRNRIETRRVGPYEVDLQAQLFRPPRSGFQLPFGDVHGSDPGLHARQGEGGMIVPAADDAGLLSFQSAGKGSDQLEGAALESQFGFLRAAAPQPVPLAHLRPGTGDAVPASAVGFVHGDRPRRVCRGHEGRPGMKGIRPGRIPPALRGIRRLSIIVNIGLNTSSPQGNCMNSASMQNIVTKRKI